MIRYPYAKLLAILPRSLSIGWTRTSLPMFYLCLKFVVKSLMAFQERLLVGFGKSHCEPLILPVHNYVYDEVILSKAFLCFLQIRVLMSTASSALIRSIECLFSSLIACINMFFLASVYCHIFCYIDHHFCTQQQKGILLPFLWARR